MFQRMYRLRAIESDASGTTTYHGTNAACPRPNSSGRCPGHDSERIKLTFDGCDPDHSDTLYIYVAALGNFQLGGQYDMSLNAFQQES